MRSILSFRREYNLFSPAYWFGEVDARPFALFRIVFGLLLLKKALYALPLIGTFYSDAGIVPRSALPVFSWDHFSLLNLSGEAWLAVLCCVVWALAALGLTLGWRTRLMSVICFVLLVSVFNRNPFINNGADVAMCAFAFWGMFVPLGRCYSLDARRTPYPPTPSRRGELAGHPYNNLPTLYAFPARMMQLQIALIYIFNAVIKGQGAAWNNGDALYLALQARLYVFPWGDWLLTNAPLDLLRLLTHATLLIEGGFVLLVFAPVLQPRLRALGLLLGVALHIGIGAVMAVPNFPLIMLASYLLLLDPRWLDGVGRWGRRGGHSSAMSLQYQPLQQRDEVSFLPQLITAAGRGMGRGALTGLLGCIMALVIWGNLSSTPTLAGALAIEQPPPALSRFLYNAGLVQSWAMFAPEPLYYDSWFILAGTLSDGRVLDLRTDAPPGEARPRWWLGPWAVWSKFEENLATYPPENPLLRAWGKYLCQQRGDLVSLEIILRQRANVAPGQPPAPDVDALMLRQTCSR